MYRYYVSWGNTGKYKNFSSWTAASYFAEWAVKNLTYVRIHDRETGQTFKAK